MSIQLAGAVRGGFRLVARVVQRTVCRWLLAVVVPAVPIGAEDLIHADDETIAVEALAAIDFEYLTVRQLGNVSRFPLTRRSDS
jgi:hypothetical protein